MKLKRQNRKFKVGISHITLNEVAKLSLKSNEMVTFLSGRNEYDIVKKIGDIMLLLLSITGS
jgi:hypothetical protein